VQASTPRASFGASISRQAVQQHQRTLDGWVGRRNQPPSSLEHTDCSALLLHPTETVRRRLLARASLIIILPDLAPPQTETSQVNPVGYSYKIAAPSLSCSTTHVLSLLPLLLLLYIYTPPRSLCLAFKSQPPQVHQTLHSLHRPQSWYVP
jgi:hypothetical protein